MIGSGFIHCENCCLIWSILFYTWCGIYCSWKFFFSRYVEHGHRWQTSGYIYMQTLKLASDLWPSVQKLLHINFPTFFPVCVWQIDKKFHKLPAVFYIFFYSLKWQFIWEDSEVMNKLPLQLTYRLLSANYKSINTWPQLTDGCSFHHNTALWQIRFDLSRKSD